MPAKFRINTEINGEAIELLCEPRQSLLEVLRDELNLTGTKEGCNNGNCGACNVLLNGELVNSCLVLAAEADEVGVEEDEEVRVRGGDTSGHRAALAAILG